MYMYILGARCCCNDTEQLQIVYHDYFYLLSIERYICVTFDREIHKCAASHSTFIMFIFFVKVNKALIYLCVCMRVCMHAC